MLERTLAYINPIHKIKASTCMYKNIHNYTNTMDKKWICLLVINKYISYKLSRKIFKIEKSSPSPVPPPLQSYVSMESSQENDNLGNRINV